MRARTLGRYIGWKFCSAAIAVFVGVFLLVVLIDYIETTRRSASIPNVPAWTVALTSLYRVPQITERLMPFSVQIGAMAAFLTLSRRNELVIARAAGISAWQFIRPAVVAALFIGAIGAAFYNPLAAHLGEESKRLEESIFGSRAAATQTGFWLRQRGGDGQSILYATGSRDQGDTLTGVSAFVYDAADRFSARVEADTAKLEPGRWFLQNARVYTTTSPPQEAATYSLPTNLTAAQIRESVATPETVPFWQLPSYIDLAEQAGLVAAGYRLQFQLLLARPFLLGAMVLLAASVSLRFVRFGGVPHMILGGIAAGFLLYVMSKVTEDLAKAQLMYAVTAAWLPVVAGALTGIVTLLYQEDG